MRSRLSALHLCAFQIQNTELRVNTLSHLELEVLTPSGQYSGMNKLQSHIVIAVGAHSLQ